MSRPLSDAEAWVLREAHRAWHLGCEVEFLCDDQIATARALAEEGLLDRLPDASFQITDEGRKVLAGEVGR